MKVIDSKKAIYETRELTIEERCVMGSIVNGVPPVEIPYLLGIDHASFNQILESLDLKNLIKYKNNTITIQPVLAWDVNFVRDIKAFVPGESLLDKNNRLADRKTLEMIVSDYGRCLHLEIE